MGGREQYLGRLHWALEVEDRAAGQRQTDPDGTGRRIRHARRGGLVRRKSVGFRLAGWYFAVFACGLALFSIAAWFAMRASVYHAIDDELRDRVRGVKQFMDNQIASLSLLEIRDEFREHSVLGPGGDLFQVCDQEGQWLYRSVPLENANISIALPGAFPAPAFQDVQIDRHWLRFYSQRI